jgi:hypothetical protein
LYLGGKVVGDFLFVEWAHDALFSQIEIEPESVRDPIHKTQQRVAGEDHDALLSI